MGDHFESILIMTAALVMILFAGFRGSCAESDGAVRAVENMGFTEVKVVDKSIFFVGLRGCDAKDAARFEMRGKNPAGKTVFVVVCAGWPFKGYTVRSE